MFTKKDIYNKKILLALDLNEKPSRSSFRIQSSLLSIQKILEFKPKQLVLISHYGRPEGIDPDYSLEEHAKILSGLIGQEVQLISGTEEEGYDDIGDGAGLYLLENLRFFNWQKLKITDKLTNNSDYLIYDAFGLVHRDKPYTTGLIQAFGKQRVFTGLLVDKEVEKLDEFLRNNAPKYLILGGKKIGDKIPILDSLLPKVEKILIIGAVTNASYKALGISIGASYINLEGIGNKEISLEQIKKYYESKKIILPEYVILDNKKQVQVDLKNNNTKIPEDRKIVDIDPASYDNIDLKKYAVFWNGNAGITEDGFNSGTEEIANKIIKSKYSIAAGGDTAKWLIQNLDLATKFDHISTGGGAALEYIAKDGDLPVLKILE
ncbi:MAG: phosphoglycerate kinase [bacterium]